MRISGAIAGTVGAEVVIVMPLGELSTARPGPPRLSISTVGIDAAPPAAPPARLGRFVVLDPLGKGGMGSVYSAWDRTLERRVAIKLLHNHDGALFRSEARALARLTHPNVVTVYDVVSAEGHDFIAMELVEGVSLRRWLVERRRSWREVLAVFRHAGRGLAAAHRAGLVHRDFKPDNVLIAHSGAVRVADFGLARAVGDTSELPGISPDGAFTVVGTPRYMAPEQRSGGFHDVGVDQYSFCLALQEALFGRLPVDDKEVLQPALGRVPAWLRQALERGVAEDPGRRFPSMDALLAALERDDERRRRRLALAGIVAAVACLAAASRQGEAAPSCAGGEARLAGVWDGAVRARVARAFSATGRPHSAATFEGAAAALDRRAADWVAARREACEATRVRGEGSEALLDMRMTCLDRDLRQMGALTALFGRAADPQILDQSIQAVRQLDEPGACAGAAIPAPADPAVASRVAALRERLAEVTALRLASKLDQALPRARAAVVEARADGHLPALAEALLELATVESDLSDVQGSRVHYEELLQVAARAHDDRRFFVAWLNELRVVGDSASETAAALAMRPALDAALMRAGDDPELRARFELLTGMLLKIRGDYVGARASLEQAIASLEKAPGDQEIRLASAENQLFITLRASGKLADARLHAERALAIYTRVLGPTHPYVAGMINNLGNLLREEGKLDEAREHYQRALALWEGSTGPDSSDVASALTNLGVVSFAQGRQEDAVGMLERARVIKEKLFGQGDRRLAGTLTSLAEAYASVGRFDEAEALARRGLAIREKTSGPDQIAVAVASLAIVAQARGDLEGALGHTDRALAMAALALPADHPDRLAILVLRADILLAMGHSVEASAGYQEVNELRPGQCMRLFQRADPALFSPVRVAGPSVSCN